MSFGKALGGLKSPSEMCLCVRDRGRGQIGAKLDPSCLISGNIPSLKACDVEQCGCKAAQRFMSVPKKLCLMLNERVAAGTRSLCPDAPKSFTEVWTILV